MSELIALKCSSCGGSLEAAADQMEIRSQSAVLRSGTILECPHCHTKHAAGTELPRQMTVNNIGGMNFTAGGNITVNVGRDLVTGDRHLPPRPKKPFAAEFLAVLREHFSMDEVEDLCFNFGVKADNLDGGNASSKARNLIQYAQRRDRLKELLVLCEELRPELHWPAYREPERRPRPKPRAKQPTAKTTPPQKQATATAAASPPPPTATKQTPPPHQTQTQPETSETDDSLGSKVKSWFQKLRGG